MLCYVNYVVILIYQTLPLENNDNSSLINCTNNIRNWLINNNLLLSIDKTQLINISKKLTQNKFPIYLIDNLIVEPSKTVKKSGCHYRRTYAFR